MKLGVNTPQMRAISSTKKIILFVAGLGVGKSIAEGIWSIAQATRVHNNRGLIVASTKEQFRDSTWPRLQEAWEWLGFVEDQDYVVGVQPPNEWGVRPWFPSNNSNIVTFAWGAYAKLGSTERFNAHRGPEYDWIVGDELRDWKKGAVEVLVGRLRGGAFGDAGLKSQAFFGTTWPDDPDAIEKYFDGEEVEVIHGSTFDNYKNLPPDYIATQAMILDELAFRREVLGLRVDMAGLRGAYSYEHKEAPHGNLLRREIDRDRPIYLTWDFNSSQSRPMTTGWIQKFPDYDVVVDETVNNATTTETQCDIITDKLKAMDYRGRIYVRGDATGNDTGRQSVVSISDYKAIQRAFSSGNWTYEGHRTRRTKRIKDRVSALNAQFESFPGRVRHLMVNPKCTKTTEALRKLKFKENRYELEDNHYREPFDALSYYADFEYPTNRAELNEVATRG